MGVAILASDGKAVLYCNTTDIAFGPVIPDAVDYAPDCCGAEDEALAVLDSEGIYDAETTARAFLDSLDTDARTIPESELVKRFNEWFSALLTRIGWE